MLRNIKDAVSYDTHCNIMPWHPPVFSFAYLVFLPIFNLLEVHNPIVIEVPIKLLASSSPSTFPHSEEAHWPGQIYKIVSAASESLSPTEGKLTSSETPAGWTSAKAC